jgi:hypothetical protein
MDAQHSTQIWVKSFQKKHSYFYRFIYFQKLSNQAYSLQYMLSPALYFIISYVYSAAASAVGGQGKPTRNLGAQLTLLQPGGQIMPTTLLLAHPDLKSQRHLWSRYNVISNS